jgi:DNA invertase Pin-like site-specific DNA recombinase
MADSTNADVSARYLRISSDQAGDMHGVANQRKATSEHTAKHGYAPCARKGPAFTGDGGEPVQCGPGEFADNDVSATKAKRRPGYDALMDAAQRGEFTVLVCYQTSRLWRNRAERVKGIETLAKAGVRIEAVKGQSLDLSTAQGRAMAMIIMEFDTLEVEEKGERTVLAQAEAAAKGLHIGGPRPFGWALVPDPARKDSAVVAHREALVRPQVDPAEARALIQAAEALVSGRTLHGLAAGLNDTGLLIPRGKKKNGGSGGQWRPSALRGALLRTRNFGTVMFNGAVLPGVWPRLEYQDERGVHVFDEALHKQVAALLDDETRHVNREWVAAGRPVKSLLSGIAWCGRCGEHMVKAAQANTYKCGAPRTSHVQRAMGAVDHVVTEWLLTRLELMPAEDRVRLLLGEELPTGPDAEEAAKLRRQIQAVQNGALEGVFTPGEAKAKVSELRGRLRAAEHRMGTVTRRPVLTAVVAAEDPRRAWEGLPLDRQRSVLRELAVVTVVPGTRGAGITRGGPATWDRPEAVGVTVEWSAWARAPLFAAGGEPVAVVNLTGEAYVK